MLHTHNCIHPPQRTCYHGGRAPLPTAGAPTAPFFFSAFAASRKPRRAHEGNGLSGGTACASAMAASGGPAALGPAAALLLGGGGAAPFARFCGRGAAAGLAGAAAEPLTVAAAAAGGGAAAAAALRRRARLRWAARRPVAAVPAVPGRGLAGCCTEIALVREAPARPAAAPAGTAAERSASCCKAAVACCAHTAASCSADSLLSPKPICCVGRTPAARTAALSMAATAA
jgi:hypothetical protein